MVYRLLTPRRTRTILICRWIDGTRQRLSKAAFNVRSRSCTRSSHLESRARGADYPKRPRVCYMLASSGATESSVRRVPSENISTDNASCASSLASASLLLEKGLPMMDQHGAKFDGHRGRAADASRSSDSDARSRGSGALSPRPAENAGKLAPTAYRTPLRQIFHALRAVSSAGSTGMAR